ncbi:heavy-metal-associated domain-containing protein [Pedobacter sp. MW01-1-1]|uniref:heavy-metal-associated domain-containing protein n=1 Tax=Pedobacter sp. MW01-1-1 TaxID=3383027 RepID=UPI003FF0E3ED
MTHHYTLTGMTCSGCEYKVKHTLMALPDVENVEVSKDTQKATITMRKHLSLETLKETLAAAGSKYQISNAVEQLDEDAPKTWFETYKPILLIFGYVTLVALIGSWQNNSIRQMLFMRIFMAGFFLTFSFFKLLNLKGFAESYAMYDLIAKKFKGWGFLYPFIELALGISFALNFAPVITNWITLIVMTVSILGVLESVLNKKKIKCACLGDVFNLPMSTVTIVEDALMIAMSGYMLFLF